ncbi:MAG: TonB family protein [Raineya sp.]|jgi:protein TonB|nr:TonB family protein [Raineya sp.]
MNLQDFCYQPHVGFEGRNQAYGAYDLRKKYSKVLSTTLLVVAFSSVTLFATPLIQRAFSPKEEVVKQVEPPIDSTIPIDIITPPDERKEKEKTIVVIEPIKEQQIATIDYQEINITPEEIKKKLVETDSIKDDATAISDETKKGDGSPIKPDETITDTKGNLMDGTGEEPKVDIVLEPFMVAQDASFEGGINEFRKKLQKQIVYPSLARKKGTEGTVTLQFVVEKDGSISNVTILKGIGDGCDEESIKALSKINTLWAPAKDGKGKSVRVRKTIPIKFALNQ